MKNRIYMTTYSNTNFFIYAVVIIFSLTIFLSGISTSTGAPEGKGPYDMDHIMQIAFSVGEDGDVNLCFGDSTMIEDPHQLQQMSDFAYPNNAEVLCSKHGLWLSMFTRHMDDFSVMEVELEE